MEVFFVVLFALLFSVTIIIQLQENKRSKNSTYRFSKTNLKDRKLRLIPRFKRGLFGGRVDMDNLPRTKNGKQVKDVTYAFQEEQISGEDTPNPNRVFIGPRGGRYTLVQRADGSFRRDYF
tara:strand:- start:2223 stop:2585 length:363 start_codon:yes stop_codon:yes gene_type:complete